MRDMAEKAVIKNFHRGRTHYWGCGRTDMKIPRDKQIILTSGDIKIVFCDVECFIERLGRLLLVSLREK